MVEEALHEGLSIEFFHNIKKYDIELWTNHFLFDIITKDYVTKTSERCDAHYDLVRDIIQMSIDSRISFWQDDDTLREWIYLLVEQKYPWFVCSSWNHLRPTAISFLHNASLLCCHTGNLHQLLHQNMISHLWEDADFMISTVDQATFFHSLEHHNQKSFLKTFKKQLEYYPYDNLDFAKITLEAMCLWKSSKILKLFLKHEKSNTLCIEYSEFILSQLCTNGMVASFEDVFYKMYDKEPVPSIHTWINWFLVIYGNYQSSSWKKRSQRKDLYHMFHCLLQTFEHNMSPENWCELVTITDDYDSPLIQMFMHTKHAKELYTTLFFSFRKALQSLPEDFTTEIYTDMDHQCTIIKWSNIRDAKDLFHKLDSLVANCNGWTAFANALRWGNIHCIQWMFDQCKENDITFATNTICKTASFPPRWDNPLTLVMYNPEIDILNRFKNSINDETQISDWIIQDDCRSIITALARLSFFHTEQQVMQRWEMINTIHTSLAQYKSTMVITFLDEWYEHVRLTYPNNETEDHHNDLEKHYFFKTILSLQSPLNAAASKYVLVSLNKLECFNTRIQTILKYGMTNILKTYCALASDTNVPVSYLYAFESLDVFKNELVHTSSGLYKLILAWSSRPSSDIKDFIYRLKNQWNQNTHNILPSDYAHYACTDFGVYNDETQLKDLWYVWLNAGLLPLCMHRTLLTHTTCTIPNLLNRVLKAYRMLRRCAQRRWKKLHSEQPLYINHKKLMFIVKCSSYSVNKRRRILP